MINKVIEDSKIYFYLDNKMIMSMGFQFDEFVWIFYDSNIINIPNNT